VGRGAHTDASPITPARYADRLTAYPGASPAATPETRIVHLNQVLAVGGTQAERIRSTAVGLFDGDGHSPRPDDRIKGFGSERSTDIAHDKVDARAPSNSRFGPVGSGSHRRGDPGPGS
jgi:hypothetical protein